MSMIYATSIKVLANTAEADPKKTNIKITNGIITKVQILFPNGCSGLVNFQLFDGGHQIVPSTQGQVLKGDGVNVVSDEFLEINNAPRLLTAVTWNDDDTYDHTIEVLITQLPPIAIPHLAFAEGIVRSLKNLFIRERKE